ncbi:GNAT family N-acetyltransferase [Pseudoalteromonas sp. MMG010]|uniref:GNAT family N-acetyltransferase n=1 Tax=Pseudoalteromonas sp. MMG010 TaxID=2822685 RepID=UPI001B3A5F08|nr:GNAT family N-acetyltransferase [Pseudoalteromonas sp. MMG010]MBQ4832406.1 GNAT family N-acetyltransferase [Pseudoalteromonas sp. MMG010]
MFLPIKSHRITLNLISHKHGPGLYNILNEFKVAQYNDYKIPLSKTDIKLLIQGDIEGNYEGKTIRAAIEHNTNGELIGTCGLYKIQANSAYIGFELTPHFWHQGYMSETLKEFIPAAIHYLNLKTIYAKVSKFNNQSEQLLLKHGFKIQKSDNTYNIYQLFNR